MTIIVTVVGTLANLVLTSLFAYPLSRQDFKPAMCLPLSCSSPCCLTVA